MSEDFPLPGSDEMPTGGMSFHDTEAQRAIDAATKIVDLERLAENEHFNATHDHLTGLFNLAGLSEQLQQHIDILEKHGVKEFEALFVDGTNIKRINDEIGHETGDEVIRGMAHILRSSIRKGDLLARIGGDEFVIVPGGEHFDSQDSSESLAMERRTAEESPDGSPLEKRIEELTDKYLTMHPEFVAKGMDIAIGRKRVQITPKLNFQVVINEAETEMKLHKAEQHALKGQYRPTK